MSGFKSKNKNEKQRIVVKRIRKTVSRRALGTWKIAYADFVTALMAFFLLMWLTSTIPQSDLRLIAEYFKTPLLVTLSGGQSQDMSDSLIKGTYGDDMTKESGQIKSLTQILQQVNRADQKEEKLLHLQEVQQLQLLKRQLERIIEADPTLSRFRNQLKIDLTSEGLRILIVDEKNRPMFELGSAVLQPYAKEILREIGKVINQVPNKIGLSGHTDATQYQTGGAGYSNWELSVERANASRRELMEGGMDQTKILRVVGLSSSALFNARDPFDPHNRRISIIVMNRETEESITQHDEPEVVLLK